MTGSKRLAIIIFGFFWISVQANWNSTPLSGYILPFGLPLLMVLTAMHCVWNFGTSRRKRNLVIAAICYLFAVVNYEVFLPFILPISAIGLFRFSDKHSLWENFKQHIRPAFIAISIVALVFVVATLITRSLSEVKYPGTRFGELLSLRPLAVVWQYNDFRFSWILLYDQSRLPQLVHGTNVHREFCLRTGVLCGALYAKAGLGGKGFSLFCAVLGGHFHARQVACERLAWSRASGILGFVFNITQRLGGAFRTLPDASG